MRALMVQKQLIPAPRDGLDTLLGVFVGSRWPAKEHVRKLIRSSMRRPGAVG